MVFGGHVDQITMRICLRMYLLFKTCVVSHLSDMAVDRMPMSCMCKVLVPLVKGVATAASFRIQSVGYPAYLFLLLSSVFQQKRFFNIITSISLQFWHATPLIYFHSLISFSFFSVSLHLCALYGLLYSTISCFDLTTVSLLQLDF